jgi:hypothetical protein
MGVQRRERPDVRVTCGAYCHARPIAAIVRGVHAAPERRPRLRQDAVLAPQLDDLGLL